MSIILSNTEMVTNMRYSFLKMNRHGDPLDISDFKGKNVIYVVENLRTHKLYVGKTTNLLNRANNYTLNYRKYVNEGIESNRTIAKAINAEGIENFRMYPIALANDREELAKLEYQYIIQLNTLIPIGYNDVIPSPYSGWKSREGCTGFSQSTETKIAKSKMVACVNQETKEFIVAIGMKIFGDYIGSSKDQVKNCAKRGIKHHDFHIIYINNYDRNDIRDKIYARYDAHYSDRHKGFDIAGYNLTRNFNGYLTALSYVELMLDDQSVQCLIDDGYNCRFLSYPSSEDSDSLFEFYDINVLFQYLNK